VHSRRVLRSSSRGFLQPMYSLDVAEGAGGGRSSKCGQEHARFKSKSTVSGVVGRFCRVMWEGLCTPGGC
jgi:hypothetical protein